MHRTTLQMQRARYLHQPKKECARVGARTNLPYQLRNQLQGDGRHRFIFDVSTLEQLWVCIGVSCSFVALRCRTTSGLSLEATEHADLIPQQTSARQLLRTLSAMRWCTSCLIS